MRGMKLSHHSFLIGQCWRAQQHTPAPPVKITAWCFKKIYYCYLPPKMAQVQKLYMYRIAESIMLISPVIQTPVRCNILFFSALFHFICLNISCERLLTKTMHFISVFIEKYKMSRTSSGVFLNSLTKKWSVLFIRPGAQVIN